MNKTISQRILVHIAIAVFCMNSLSAMAACCVDISADASVSPVDTGSTNLPPCHQTARDNPTMPDQQDEKGDCCLACLSIMALPVPFAALTWQHGLLADRGIPMFAAQGFDPPYRPPNTNRS